MIIRFFDVALSFILIVCFLPLFFVVAIILRLTGEGEIFYFQKRLGRNGKEFQLIKFATMLKNSPNLGSGDITIENDPRVLRFGRFLRKTKINELPQLFNILKGDMSFVGPRPQTLRNFQYFPDEYKKIIVKMRPGLTGIGSIVFRDEESIIAKSNKSVEDLFTQDIGPYKGRLELWYFSKQNVFLYFLLIILTVWVVFFPKSLIYRSLFKSLPEQPNSF